MGTLLLFPVFCYAQTTLSGRLLDDNDSPIGNASIRSVVYETQWIVDREGKFEIVAQPTDTLSFRAIGYGEIRMATTDFPENGIVRLPKENNVLEDVEIVHTGFQSLKKEQITGAVDIISEDLLNRTTGTDFLSRIEGLTPGLQFNKGVAAETDPFLIRGRSTFTAEAQPLIVLDDFPYEGELHDINPNDVASVTVLKDAAAASIWGARAANGVIVVKTKEGRGSRTKIEFKTDIALESRPDLQHIDWITASEMIDFEKQRFAEGGYDNLLEGPYYGRGITPVLELLFKQRGNPDDHAIDGQIEAFKEHDVRKDMAKYLYRSAPRQQYHVGLSGSTDNLNYMFSAGYYDQAATLRGTNQNRFTLRSNNTFKIAPFLDIQHTLQFTRSENRSGDNPGYAIGGIYPYAQLVDDAGNPANLYLDYPKAYLDTLGGGELLDWTYNPVRDLTTVDNRTKNNNITTGLGINVKPFTGLTVAARYQYQYGKTETANNNGADSYSTRTLVNRFSYYENNQWNRPIPIGGILDYSNTSLVSHQGRIQADYSATWKEKYSLDAIGGYEIRSRTEDGQRGRLYGYYPERMTTIPTIDYVRNYTILTTGTTARISPVGSVSKMTDNFLSWYGNATFGYHNSVFLSGSVRKDQANLFGVAANAKGAPFWSTGIRWEIGKLPALEKSSIDRLALRFTYGINGNVSRSASALTTMYYVNYTGSGLPGGALNSPPNRNLRWERVLSSNLGLDFSLWSGTLYGSVDYYHKNGRDLLSEAPVDPTLGVSHFFGNIASMDGKGVDVILTSRNLKNVISWNTTLNLSYTQGRVREYLMPVGNVPTVYLSGTTIAPIEGKPLYSLFSYPWAGLDPENGDPLGYLEGAVSKDYQNITTGTRIEEMVFNGPVQAPWYGSLRNDFRYKGIGLSINVSYKFGGYFRALSYASSNLLTGFNTHSDFSKRWQKPGDEEITQIPSFDPEDVEGRGMFYRYSDVLALRSDNIRLEDILLSYDIKPSRFLGVGFGQMRCFVQVQHINLAWLGNERKIDPYFNNVPLQGASFIAGINLSL